MAELQTRMRKANGMAHVARCEGGCCEDEHKGINEKKKAATKQRRKAKKSDFATTILYWRRRLYKQVPFLKKYDQAFQLAGATVCLVVFALFVMLASASTDDNPHGIFSNRIARRLMGIGINDDKYKFIPKAEWPFTLKDHPEQFETILHPGDEVTEMAVPTFWSPPIHNNTLMPRDLAMKIGICSKPDSQGNFVRGDECPLNERTLLVAIASYRDYQCRMTVESLFERAAHPERIRVVVTDQIVDGLDVACDVPIKSCEKDPNQALCKYKEQLDVLEVEAKLSVGPVFARHLGNRMYRGEYYAMQSDAHITFVHDWDVDAINQFEATKNEMAVLTTYLSDVRGSVDESGHSLRSTRPIMCNTVFDGRKLEHDQQPESSPKISGSPQLEPWWGAGFSFSRGHFVVNVPYDQYLPLIFQGEEMSISVRGFSCGYDFYTVERSVCFHHYHRKKEPAGYFNENENKYPDDLYERSMSRLLAIARLEPKLKPYEWNQDDKVLYGLGGVRSPEKFYETYGINVEEKETQGHMCRWVDNGKEDGMHMMFTPYLRDDGMGIDYERISYRFTDPLPDEHDSDDEEDEEGAEEEEGEATDDDSENKGVMEEA